MDFEADLVSLLFAAQMDTNQDSCTLEFKVNLSSVVGSKDLDRLQKKLDTNEISEERYEECVGRLALGSIANVALGASSAVWRMDDQCCDKFLRRVHEDAPRLVQSIFGGWGELQSINSAYGDIIVKRWKKKTIKQRQTLLLKAWPGMSSKHRPDFEVVRHNLRGSQQRDALMMPFINLEDLVSEKHILTMVNSRIQKPPEHFAFSDSRNFEAAASMGAVEYTKKAWPQIMLLTGEETRETYGRLLTVLDQDAAEDLVYTEYGFPLVKGLTVLENQKRLYTFLRIFTKHLLHDIDMTSTELNECTGNPAHHECVRNSTLLPGIDTWHSVIELSIQASYDLSQPFSEDSMINTANAKLDEAQDLYWTLREDPQYFREQLLLHRKQWEKPIRKAHSIGYIAGDGPWQNTCHNLIHEVCRDVIVWDGIVRELNQLRDIKMGSVPQIQPSKRLPTKCKDQLLRFSGFAMYSGLYCSRRLYGVLLSNPDFHDFFEMAENTEIPGYGDFELKQSTKDRWPLILTLIHELSQPFAIDMGNLNILDEIDRMMTADPRHRAMMSTKMCREIGKLAAIAQIQDALLRHQPRFRAGPVDNAFMDSICAQINSAYDIQKLISKLPLLPYAKRMETIHYPAGKPRTEQHVQQMRLAEARLDTFWEQVDKGLIKQTGKSLQGLLGNKVVPKTIQRTPPWQPNQESRPVKIFVSPRPASPQFQVEDGTSFPTRLRSEEPRFKQKTKGEPDPSRAGDPTIPAVPSEDVEPSPSTFALGRGAYRTVSAFYPTSNEDRTGRKGKWKDFLHLMYSLRFDIQKRYGSDWYFEPQWQRKSPITIHEPHPSKEMRFDKIRFEANRMAQKYGWSSGTFQAA